MMEENEISYPNISQSWGIVGITIVSMIVFSPVSIFLDDFTGKEISFFIYYLLATGAAFWIAHSKRKKLTGLNGYSFDFSSARIIILVCVAVIALQMGIISPAINLLPMPEFIKKMFIELAGHHGVFSFITLVIAAPMLEELIFRGIVLDGLLKKYSPVKSIMISSILFGLIHLNPWQFIAALVLGIFSGWVYYKTKTLTLSILIHSVNNLMAFGSMYFWDAEVMMDQSLSELYGGFLNLIAITFGAIIVAVICLYLLRIEIQRMKFAVAPSQSSDLNQE